MKVATISDCHGQWARADYPPADILVFAGDILKNYSYNRDDDAFEQVVELVALNKHLVSLLEAKRYRHIVCVAGNHDFCFERCSQEARETLTGARIADGVTDGRIHYLQNEDLTLDIDGRQVKIHGAPQQPFFGNWCFNFPDHESQPVRAAMVAKTVWKLIPEALDILITHGPPFGVLDTCMDGRQVGCKHLKARLDWMDQPPKLHVFGHIHHSFGQIDMVNTDRATPRYMKAVNTAILGEDYQTMRPMPVVEI